MVSLVNKALFLDRDGVININHGYVYTADQFDFIDGVNNLVKQANQLNYKVIVVTNQSGIGRGYYSENDFLTLSDWMKLQFANQGATIDYIYYCPHHPKEAVAPYKKDCNCRKPKAGMARQAMQDFFIDPQQSIMVGDKLSDVEFACNANIKHMFWLDENPSVEDFARVAQLQKGHMGKITIIDNLEQITFPVN